MARTLSRNVSNYLSFGLNAVNALISGAGAVTVSIWCKPNTVSGYDNSDRLFNEYVVTLSSGILVATSSTSKIRVGFRSQSTDGLQVLNGATTITTGVWQHWCVVVNFTSPSIALYLNGTSDGTSTPTFGSATYSPGNTSSHFLLGAYSGGGSTPIDTGTQFDGDVGPVAVWTTALSADQVKALASGTRPERIRTDKLVINWTMDGEGSVECNRCGPGPLGTVNGSVPYAGGPGISGPFAGGESFHCTVTTTSSSASGSVSFVGSAASGSGVFSSPSSISISLSPASSAGSGGLTTTSSGAISNAAASVSGSGAFATHSSAASILSGLSASGVAGIGIFAAGSVSLASISVAGSGTAGTPGVATGTGTITFAAIQVSGVGTTSTAEFLGRFRRGDEVTIGITLAGIPDSPPLATLYGPTGQAEASYYMPTSDGLEFSVSPMVGAWPLGTFSVSIAYSIGGVAASLGMSFDVVSGGDSGGSVISMHVHSRPESNYVVAQLSSGVVVQGRNPHL